MSRRERNNRISWSRSFSKKRRRPRIMSRAFMKMKRARFLKRVCLKLFRRLILKMINPLIRLKLKK